MRRHAKAPPLAGTTSIGTRAAGAFGRFSLAILGALCAALLLGVAPASASPTEIGSFTGSGTPAGSMHPTGIATDEKTGDVYVIDDAHNVVDRFDSAGNYKSQLKVPVGEGGEFGFYGSLDGIAVDNSGGAKQGWVYVTGEEGWINAFNAAGVFQWKADGTDAVEEVGGDLCGVAVDSSGQLWTSDYFTGVVRRSSANGSPEGTPIGYEGFGTGTTKDCRIAFDAANNLFATHYHGAVSKFTAASGYASHSIFIGDEFNSSYTEVATDTSNGDVYVVSEESSVSGYDSGGTELEGSPFSSGFLRGVTVDGAHQRAYVTNEAGAGSVQIWQIGEGGEEPSGPTNRAALTLTKAPNPSAGTGTGTVTSKPKGIKCATACDEAVGSFYKQSTVVLKAKASNGDTLSGWSGCDSSTNTGTEGTCTVAMSGAKEVTATFGGTSKAIAAPQPLSLSKGESTGFGTVKGTGIACEAECSDTTALYQGEYEYKPGKFKAAKVVVLSAAPAFGSEFSGWSGCDSVSEGKCTVTMSGAKDVSAEFTAKPNVALTIEKGGAGTGTVTSKPKGLKCAATCTQQTMAVPSGEAIVLKAKAANGMTFVGWSGGGCSGNAETCTVSPSVATTVTATFSGTPKAILSPTALTVEKAGSGLGAVKAAGLACEALCTSATSLYQGTITEPKPKEAKIVILTALSAPGSGPVSWSGCDSEPEGNCQVQMSGVKSVTATFAELE